MDKEKMVKEIKEEIKDLEKSILKTFKDKINQFKLEEVKKELPKVEIKVKARLRSEAEEIWADIKDNFDNKGIIGFPKDLDNVIIDYDFEVDDIIGGTKENKIKGD